MPITSRRTPKHSRPSYGTVSFRIQNSHRKKGSGNPYSRRNCLSATITFMKKILKKRPAVFLDRDGTIIKQVELLNKASQVKILPGSAEAIKTFNKLGYLVVIITN